MITQHQRVSLLHLNDVVNAKEGSCFLVQCVVQSYLKWLEDADYDPVCVLCTKSIQEGGDVVRLVCYGTPSK